MSSVSAKKPFAVEQVTNTQGVIPSYGLSAEYDARGKVSSITEYDTWRTLLFTYGPDGGRWQMAVGHLYNQDYNTVVGADRVDYLDGATFATYYSKTKEDGVTLGNFINITNPDRISGDFSSYVTKNQLYMHEFGHYVDSHYWGLSYLMCIGIPSLYSASKSGNYQKILNDNGEFIGYIPPNHNHDLFWTEKRANRRAWRHFRDHHGLKKWIDKDENTLLPMYPRHKLHY